MMLEESGLPEKPEDVGSLLRLHRERRRLTGGVLAARTGLSQAKVSRIETGRTAASESDVRLLAQGLGLSTEETQNLVALAGRRRVAPAPASHRPDRAGFAHRQSDVGRAELSSQEIRLFQPSVVPGLLQTSGYAEAIMRTPLRVAGVAGADASDAALLEAVAGRMKRQQILKVPDRRFYFVMIESVLANRMVSPEDMLAQIRRIREFAREDNVSIRIIPADAVLAHPPSNSFELLDDKWVLIDLFHALVTSQAPVDIEIYDRAFDLMTEASVEDIDPILDRYVQIYKAELG